MKYLLFGITTILLINWSCKEEETLDLTSANYPLHFKFQKYEKEENHVYCVTSDKGDFKEVKSLTTANFQDNYEFAARYTPIMDEILLESDSSLTVTINKVLFPLKYKMKEKVLDCDLALRFNSSNRIIYNDLLGMNFVRKGETPPKNLTVKIWEDFSRNIGVSAKGHIRGLKVNDTLFITRLRTLYKLQ